MRKNNKGITMIEIVIVIIILILLAVIAIWNSWPSYLKGEGTNILREFKSVETGAIMIRNIYNTNPDFELEPNVHYCEKYTITSGDNSGDVWYTIYGRDDSGESWYEGKDGVFKTIINNWGLDDLKRSYDIKIDGDLEIKFSNGNYVEINNFKVYSYEDLKSLLESGAF